MAREGVVEGTDVPKRIFGASDRRNAGQLKAVQEARGRAVRVGLVRAGGREVGTIPEVAALVGARQPRTGQPMVGAWAVEGGIRQRRVGVVPFEAGGVETHEFVGGAEGRS